MYARLSLMSLGPRAGSRDVAEKLADIFRPVCMEQRGIVDATFIIGNTENGNAGEYVSLSVWKTKVDGQYFQSGRDARHHAPNALRPDEQIRAVGRGLLEKSGVVGTLLASATVAAQAQLLPGLELVRVQVVPRQQLVEIGAIAFRKACRLAHIAHRDLQDL